MLWILGVIAVIVLVAFLLSRAGGAGTPLLEARIGTEDGVDYFVQYVKKHPEAAPVEYARLALGLATKLVFNLGKNDQEAHIILSMLERLGRTDLSQITCLHSVTLIEVGVKEIDTPPAGKVIVAKLGYRDRMLRTVDTRLPATWFEDQFFCSFLAVVESALSHLDPRLRSRLQGSFRRLSELYDSGDMDPFSLSGLHQAPNTAFITAEPIHLTGLD